MVHIDYYFTVLSPFTYLAGAKLETIAARRGVAIRYKPVAIAELFAATGAVAPKDRHPSRQAYRLQELKRIAKRETLPINLQPAFFPTDAAPASRALIAAQEAGFSVGLAAHGFTRAVWAEEKNIAEAEIVAEVLKANGVSQSAIEPHLAGAEAMFAQNTKDAIAAGVFGSPTYVVGEEVFWGQDRLDYLDAHLGELTG